MWRHRRLTIIIAALVVALAAVIRVWWPRSVNKHVNEILGGPAGDQAQSYENARAITKAQMMELIRLSSIDARKFRNRDRVLRLTGGRLHLFTPDYVSVRIVTAGKNVVFEPLLEIARDESMSIGIRLWALRQLCFFNDQKVFDAWMEFLESAPMYSSILFLVLPVDSSSPYSSQLSGFAALKSDMAGKTYEEFVLGLLDARVRDPELAPNDSDILRWLDRYGGLGCPH